MTSINSDDLPSSQSPTTQRSKGGSKSTNPRHIQELPTGYGYNEVNGEGNPAKILQSDDQSRSAYIQELQRTIDALRAQQKAIEIVSPNQEGYIPAAKEMSATSLLTAEKTVYIQATNFKMLKKPIGDGSWKSNAGKGSTIATAFRTSTMRVRKSKIYGRGSVRYVVGVLGLTFDTPW